MDDVDANDAQKLHGEINQLINQQFLITLSALTLFGVMNAWEILGVHSLYNDSPIDTFPDFYIFLPVCCLMLLMILVLWLNHLVTINLRLAVYLVVNNLSRWEKQIDMFQSSHNFKFSQRNSMLWVFLVLGIISFCSPVFLAEEYLLELCSTHKWFLGGASFLYCAAIITIMTNNLDSERNKIKLQWIKLKSAQDESNRHD